MWAKVWVGSDLGSSRNVGFCLIASKLISCFVAFIYLTILIVVFHIFFCLRHDEFFFNDFQIQLSSYLWQPFSAIPNNLKKKIGLWCPLPTNLLYFSDLTLSSRSLGFEFPEFFVS